MEPWFGGRFGGRCIHLGGALLILLDALKTLLRRLGYSEKVFSWRRRKRGLTGVRLNKRFAGQFRFSFSVKAREACFTAPLLCFPALSLPWHNPVEIFLGDLLLIPKRALKSLCPVPCVLCLVCIVSIKLDEFW